MIKVANHGRPGVGGEKKVRRCSSEKEKGYILRWASRHSLLFHFFLCDSRSHDTWSQLLHFQRPFRPLRSFSRSDAWERHKITSLSALPPSFSHPPPLPPARSLPLSQRCNSKSLRPVQAHSKPIRLQSFRPPSHPSPHLPTRRSRR